MSDVIFVLAVIGFWALVSVLMVVLIRMAAGSHDEEHVVCELPEDYFHPAQVQANIP